MKPVETNALYIGTNYHPHDWPQARWAHDLDLMAQCGFTVVRLGHLCWDSFEPEEGKFTFEWMDQVMDLCQERGIGVFFGHSHPAGAHLAAQKIPLHRYCGPERHPAECPFPLYGRCGRPSLPGNTPTAWRL